LQQGATLAVPVGLEPQNDLLERQHELGVGMGKRRPGF
jgi:hypothetical protein